MRYAAQRTETTPPPSTNAQGVKTEVRALITSTRWNPQEVACHVEAYAASSKEMASVRTTTSKAVAVGGDTNHSFDSHEGTSPRNAVV